MLNTRKDEKTPKNNLKKCVRKGDIIHYSKPENINMVRKENTQKQGKNLLETEADKVSSGESLYKTFNFEQSDNDEETEKCIAFWKFVVEKNLQHIKCAIIKNKHKTSVLVEEDQTDTPKVDQKVLEEKMKEVHQEYSNAWQKALKEIQRKRLNEVELIGKSRCKLCESISSKVDISVSPPDKNEISKEIKELDNWESKSRKRAVSREKILKISEKQSEDGKQMTTWASMTKPPQDTNTYIFKDVIAEKKENRTYSAWRDNQVICHCNQPHCTCGYNPAVISVEPAIPVEPEKPLEPAIKAPTPQGVSVDISERTIHILQEATEATDETMESPKVASETPGEVTETLEDATYAETIPGEVNMADLITQYQNLITSEPPSTVPSAKFLYTAEQYSDFTIPSEYTPPSVTQMEYPSEEKTKQKTNSVQKISTSRKVVITKSYDGDVRFNIKSDQRKSSSAPLIPESEQKTSGSQTAVTDKKAETRKRLTSILKNKMDYIPVTIPVRSPSDTSIDNTPETENPSIVEFLNKMKDLKKTISLIVKRCQCSYSNCDCFDLTAPGKVTEDVPSIPSPPRYEKQAMRKRDSVMIYREKSQNLMESQINLDMATDNEDGSTDTLDFIYATSESSV